jgi:hypothetical protein
LVTVALQLRSTASGSSSAGRPGTFHFPVNGFARPFRSLIDRRADGGGTTGNNNGAGSAEVHMNQTLFVAATAWAVFVGQANFHAINTRGDAS